MWPNTQFPVDLATFTEEILIGKLNFLCSSRVAGPEAYSELCQTCKIWSFLHKYLNSFNSFREKQNKNRNINKLYLDCWKELWILLWGPTLKSLWFAVVFSINSFMTEVLIKKKPLHWFARQTNEQVSIW